MGALLRSKIFYLFILIPLVLGSRYGSSGMFRFFFRWMEHDFSRLREGQTANFSDSLKI